MSREIRAIKALPVTSKSADGQHILEFSETSHRYKLDGKPCVGTTTMLKGGYPTSMGLISWFKSQTAEALFKSLTVPGEKGWLPRDGFYPITEEAKKELIKTAKAADRAVSQEAADIGTILHSYAELHSLAKHEEAEALLDQARKVEAWPLIESCVRKYREWAKIHGGEPFLAESLVASPIHLFCGKIDRTDKVNGEPVLRDYKTSKGFFLDQKIQLAAYRIALREWLGLNVKAIEIVRFGKEDGTFETDLVDDPKILSDLEDQAIRCRETFEFIRKYEKKYVPKA